MKTPKKIALFGWYMHGNFGDDLMAVMLSRAIRAEGFHPVVYKLPRYIAEPEGLECAHTIESLLEGATACVLGGGGLLVSGDHPPYPAFLRLDDEMRRIGQICGARSIPVWGVSIGGTGGGRAARLYPGLASLLSSRTIQGVTLRLQSDKPLLDAFDIPSQHFPDVVFLAPDFWPSASAEPRRTVLTNNLGESAAGRALVAFLDRCGPRVLGLTAKDVGTQHASVVDGEYQPTGRRRVLYEDIQTLADLSAGAKAILSSKLHLGIFGMTYGAVFFSYGGKAKTVAQLEELGLESQILSGRDLPGWVLRMRSGYPAEQETVSRIVPGLRAAARGHLNALGAFLHSLQGGRVLEAAGVWRARADGGALHVKAL